VSVHRLVGAALALSLLLTGCGDDGSSAAAEPSPSAPETTAPPAPLSRAEFVTQADAICLETSSHFSELEDPDGVGGAKPLGLGAFMRDWVDDLRTLTPPTAVAEDWTAGLDLVVEAADALDRAENGDPEAQSEALWSLEAQAQQRFIATGLPFHFCFVE
jgi:hypothetical protein